MYICMHTECKCKSKSLKNTCIGNVMVCYGMGVMKHSDASQLLCRRGSLISAFWAATATRWRPGAISSVGVSQALAAAETALRSSTWLLVLSGFVATGTTQSWTRGSVDAVTCSSRFQRQGRDEVIEKWWKGHFQFGTSNPWGRRFGVPNRCRELCACDFVVVRVHLALPGHCDCPAVSVVDVAEAARRTAWDFQSDTGGYTAAHSGCFSNRWQTAHYDQWLSQPHQVPRPLIATISVASIHEFPTCLRHLVSNLGMLVGTWGKSGRLDTIRYIK